MALGEKTPAEAAGVRIALGENRWKGLIERSVKAQAAKSRGVTALLAEGLNSLRRNRASNR